MQAIIFDTDGVLIDSEPLYRQHINIFLVQLGVDDPGKLTHNLQGLGSRRTSNLLIEVFGLDYEADELTDLSRKAY